MYYYQQGGKSSNNSQDELLQRAIFGFYGYMKSQGQDANIEDCVTQIAQLLSTKPETVQQIAQSDDLVDTGMEELQNDDPEVLQQLVQPGAATEILQQAIQGAEEAQVQAARHGAKLNYIKRLKGECPAGYEMAYYKAGGTVCPVCQKKAEEKKVQSAKCGKKMKKGAISKAMNGIRTEMFRNGGGTPEISHQERENGMIGKHIVTVYPQSPMYRKLKSMSIYSGSEDVPIQVERQIYDQIMDNGQDTIFSASELLPNGRIHPIGDGRTDYRGYEDPDNNKKYNTMVDVFNRMAKKTGNKQYQSHRR